HARLPARGRRARDPAARGRDPWRAEHPLVPRAGAGPARVSDAIAPLEGVPYHATLGIRIVEHAPDRVRLRIPYKDENSNPGRALHGGVYASAVDVAGVAAAAAGIAAPDGLERRTLDLSVDYLAAAIGEDIVADARVLRRGKELAYVEVDVANDAGKRLAK